MMQSKCLRRVRISEKQKKQNLMKQGLADFGRVANAVAAGSTS